MGEAQDNTEQFSMHESNQEQQQTIDEEQQHPLHFTTTPANDSETVKEELSEAKYNNDSGISDHYNENSPSGSGRSSTNSLSPENANNTQNANAMPNNNNNNNNNDDMNLENCQPSCSYSTRSSGEKCAPYQETMDESQRAIPSTSGVCNPTKSASNNNNNSIEDVCVKCGACAFYTSDRSQIIEHLTEHCMREVETSVTPDNSNPRLTKIIEQIHAIRRSSWYTSAPPRNEIPKDLNLHLPKVNSQGKVKFHRCKQCPFRALTKPELWAHLPTHIRAGRILKCPKCTFVTEYKHHLEYHMHNHAGSKPYQCKECTYSCVNKSMLNSHMKSHSDIYRYSCLDCSYITKYCHSLKLHLRKYSHKSAYVKNEDGTPCPTQIIDVYGTRRGPRQRRVAQPPNNEAEQQDNDVSANVQNDASIGDQNNADNNARLDLSAPPEQSANAVPTVTPATNGIGDAAGGEDPADVNQSQTSYSYSQLLAAFNMNQQVVLRENRRPPGPETPSTSTAIINEDCLEEQPEELILEERSSTSVGTNTINGPNDASDGITMPSIRANTEEARLTSMPLDLSRPSTSRDCPQQAVTNSPRSTSRRRKGVAVKLEHRRKLQNTDEGTAQNEARSAEAPAASQTWRPRYLESNETVSNETVSNETVSNETVSNETVSNETVNNETESNANRWFDDGFVCHYCDICFRYKSMYNTHMAFHTHRNPFKCKICGYEAMDGAVFFMHIHNGHSHNGHSYNGHIL